MTSPPSHCSRAANQLVGRLVAVKDATIDDGVLRYVTSSIRWIPAYVDGPHFKSMWRAQHSMLTATYAARCGAVGLVVEAWRDVVLVLMENAMIWLSYDSVKIIG